MAQEGNTYLPLHLLPVKQAGCGECGTETLLKECSASSVPWGFPQVGGHLASYKLGGFLQTLLGLLTHLPPQRPALGRRLSHGLEVAVQLALGLPAATQGWGEGSHCCWPPLLLRSVMGSLWTLDWFLTRHELLFFPPSHPGLISHARHSPAPGLRSGYLSSWLVSGLPSFHRGEGGVWPPCHQASHGTVCGQCPHTA